MHMRLGGRLMRTGETHSVRGALEGKRHIWLKACLLANATVSEYDAHDGGFCVQKYQ